MSKSSKTQYDKPAPKKRGRRPNKVQELEEISESSDSDSENNNQAVFVKMPAHVMKNSKKNSKKEPEPDTDTDTNVDVIKVIKKNVPSMFRNDMMGDNNCYRCKNNEKIITGLKDKLAKYEKKEMHEKATKFYANKLKLVSVTKSKKIKTVKTNTLCWWDSHSFNTYPCMLPDQYYDGTYLVIGCFCSYNCALAYNLYHMKDTHVQRRKSLVYKMYREAHGLSPDEQVEIREAPPFQILSAFGGDMSIEEFRAASLSDKEYVVYVSPIKPITSIIEEKDVGQNGNADDDGYVLKRKKPLNKSRNITASMKVRVFDS